MPSASCTLLGLDPASASTLFAAIIGGLIAGGAALLATKRSYVHTLARDERQRKALALSMLKMVRAELNVLWDSYNQNIGPQIRALAAGAGLFTTFPVSTEYFTVYNTSVALIGQVADDELRSDIVTTYTFARSMIDAVRLNNGLVERANNMNAMAARTGAPVDQHLANAATSFVNAYGQQLKAADAALVHCVENLMPALRAATTSVML